MTDNEIVKALECCGTKHTTITRGDGCHNCPMHPLHSNICMDMLHDLSLDLINRQKETIDQKLTSLFKCGEKMTEMQETIDRQKEEIVMLEKNLDEKNEELDRLYDDFADSVETTAVIRAEAVKEFAEELKKDISWHRTEMYMNGLKGTPRTHEITYETVEEYIDNLVKEFTEVG